MGGQLSKIPLDKDGLIFLFGVFLKLVTAAHNDCVPKLPYLVMGVYVCACTTEICRSKVIYSALQYSSAYQHKPNKRAKQVDEILLVVFPNQRCLPTYNEPPP